MITAYTDGACEPNPGPGGYGVHVTDRDGSTIAEFSGHLPDTTSNRAEFAGLIAALSYAIERGHRKLRIRSDSQIVVNMFTGQWRGKDPRLREYAERAKALATQLDYVDAKWIRREFNAVADRLANGAVNGETLSPPAVGEPIVPVVEQPQAVAIPVRRSFRDRRAEMLTLRREGLTIRDIAERIGCSKGAVQYALERFEKLERADYALTIRLRFDRTGTITVEPKGHPIAIRWDM